VTKSKRAQVEAAGVVLVRGGSGGPEVAVVHRPHRSDWSLPKGKLDPGERHDAAAVRETFEETGVRCALGPSLGSRRYEVNGVPKRVRYWRATVLEQYPLDPASEIDEVRWLGRDAAHELLTYEDDRALVDIALALPDTYPTIVLRHARATKRAVWKASGDPLAGVDAERTLNPYGVEQAQRIVPVLLAYAPVLVVSSSSRRCRDTVAPYAEALGGHVRLLPELSEEGCRDDRDSTVAVVEGLLELGVPAVWCTHRPVMGTVLGTIADRLGLLRQDGSLPNRLNPRMKPGSAVVLHRAHGGRVVAIDRFET
jgi:8-oxo-dGTP diphosphatase